MASARRQTQGRGISLFRRDPQGHRRKLGECRTRANNHTRQRHQHLSPPPSPPSWPAPASSSEPAPPPHEPYDEDDITDAKGVTMHNNGWQYKVTVKCKNCAAQYKTRWGENNDPYKELAKAGWEKGRDRSGNYSWQKAHCPNFRLSCYTMQT